MEWIMVAAVVAALGITAYLLLRLNQSQLQGGFKLLQDTFQGLQQNIVVFQNEFQRAQAEKSASLRAEIAKELQVNRHELQQGLMSTTQALEGKFAHIDTRLDARMKDLTSSVQTNLTANLKQGFEQFEKVQHHLSLAEVQLRNLNAVGSSINDLNNLLRLPHLRGGFGEATLERLLSDLLPRDGYELQFRIVPGSTERVDAVIKYPNQQVLPIDSKFPREQVLPLFESQDPAVLEQARKSLCEVMRQMAKSIRDKYVHPEHGTTDIALLFVPSETLYFEMLRNVKLCEELGRFKVFAVSPNTLAVTLHAISISRNYYEMAKGVEKTIADVKKAQQHFDNFEKRFTEIGSQLGRAQNAFQTAETHLGRYHSAVQRLMGEDTEALASVAPPDPERLLPQST
jgi:DNA recombination protein RmuC